ncbi:unannotated protein [freshwater metagenome]|uniref:Unannotated protein n=1 Tax=freshwater metagenome TaxID=449393 RepID=A0A6J6SDZ8_9ZZZZ
MASVDGACETDAGELSLEQAVKPTRPSKATDEIKSGWRCIFIFPLCHIAMHSYVSPSAMTQLVAGWKCFRFFQLQ